MINANCSDHDAVEYSCLEQLDRTRARPARLVLCSAGPMWSSHFAYRLSERNLPDEPWPRGRFERASRALLGRFGRYWRGQRVDRRLGIAA